MLEWQDTIPADGGDINDVAHQFRTDIIGIHQQTPSFPSSKSVKLSEISADALSPHSAAKYRAGHRRHPHSRLTQ